MKPYWNGDDVTGRPRDQWLIDFPLNLSEADAAAFQAPYEYLKAAQYSPERGKPTVSFVAYRTTTEGQNPSWWEPHRPRPEMRRRVKNLSRYLVTPETAEYRLFVWLSFPTIPDKNLIAIARDDDVTFGILQSRFHKVWSLRLGTSLEDRPRYTLTTTFATFPFPAGLTPDTPSQSYADDPRAQRIAAVAKRLDQLRKAWLYPTELVRYEAEVAEGLPDRCIPVSADAAKILQSRTLTNLYNEPPTWLTDCHCELDAAVGEAYGVATALSDDDLLALLLELNGERESS